MDTNPSPLNIYLTPSPPPTFFLTSPHAVYYFHNTIIIQYPLPLPLCGNKIGSRSLAQVLVLEMLIVESASVWLVWSTCLLLTQHRFLSYSRDFTLMVLLVELYR